MVKQAKHKNLAEWVYFEETVFQFNLNLERQIKSKEVFLLAVHVRKVLGR